MYVFSSQRSCSVPKVFLNLQLLRWVTKYKYLGTILTDDLSDDFNMLRQRGICYARCNSLIWTFSSCSLNVKVKLFKTFCCILKYFCQIWSQYKKDTVRKLHVGYNHAFRRIMKCEWYMCVANDVRSFNEIWRTSLYNFRQRVTQSNNSIVNHVFHFTRATSTIWKNCDHIYIYIIQIMSVCVCVCLSSLGGQTAGPIMTKFGTHMRIDLGMVPT